jgi:hypothetical protein
MTTPPTTVIEAHNQWSTSVYKYLISNIVDSEWASLAVASDACLSEIKTAIFGVDLDAFTALCSQVSDCHFDAANYVPYAWGFLIQ